MKSFKFYSGEENGVIIEQSNYSDSLFKEQYIQALCALERILEHPSEEDPDIISFCGERGEGKTSCMRSFTGILQNLNTKDSETDSFLSSIEVKDDFFISTNLNLQCCKVINTEYEVLKVIDPAFFDSNHNVLELVLGQMYINVLKIIDEKDDDIDQDKKNNILGLFHDAKLCLTHMYKGIDTLYDPLEELDSLSAALTLRTRMNELIDGYLEFCTGKTDGVRLVICIDDLDLNMSEAYSMVEQIRKYLVSKKCIILISLNPTQLVKVIAHSIMHIVSTNLSQDFLQVATQYVTKVLPLERRIYMPKVSTFCDGQIFIYENRRVEKQKYFFNSIKEAVVKLIYKKTRFLFFNSNGGVSPIVPNNLRNLRHLLGLLDAMPDYNSDSVFFNNKGIFETYFFQTWVKQLTKEDQSFVNLLVQRNDPSAINKLVISYLTKNLNDGYQNDLMIEQIMDPRSYNYNVTIGDVFYLLRYLEECNVDEELRLLLFFIRSFYSIRLYENYDVITTDNSNIYPSHKYSIYSTNEFNPFNHTNVMQRFVNGSYFTYFPNDVLPANKDGRPRDLIEISGTMLNTLILNDVKKYMGEYHNLSLNLQKEFEEKFVIAEFFALTLKRALTKKNLERFNQVESVDSEPVYLKKYTLQTTYYLFDVLAPFYNLLNPKFSYEKFSHLSKTEMPNFFEFALSHPWSLLRQMINQVSNKNNTDQKKHAMSNMDANMQSLSNSEPRQNKVGIKDLVSNACIRNGEILMIMMNTIYNKRGIGYDSGNTLSIIASLYKILSNLEIKIYEQSDYFHPYSIRYVFLNALSELLESEKKKGKLSYLFTILDKQIEDVEYTDEEITKFFGKFFNSFNTFKYGRTIIKEFKEKFSNFYSFLPENYWSTLFDSNIKYYKSDILMLLRSDFIKYMNKAI